MKLATSLLVAALALAPAMAFAKDKAMETKTTTTSGKMMSTSTTVTPVNINTASEKDLTKVFKSDKTAQKIIAGRTYGSIDELVSKNIVKKATYKAVEKKITVQ